MNHYLDIKLLPDSEFKPTVLMNSLYTKLHKVLCNLKSDSIGISFPNFHVTLGNVLRIHGDQSILNDLQNINWLGGMSGYCQINKISPIPSNVKYRTVSRKQATMSPAKLRRLIKRGSINEEGVKTYKEQMFAKDLSNPYVELVSSSNGHKHRRYIEFGPLADTPVVGKFDQFGLSKTATIPWF